MADRVVADRFRLLEPLGRGGMGTVWRAKDEVLGRTVALKEVSLPSSLPADERAAIRERVLREARAAARLNHSSAVTVYDVLEEDDYTFIAMEMIDSPTLAEIVADQGPLAPERAAWIGLKLLDTLEAAHARGIVHRDVKPANVMVSDRSVKLADFGIASVKGDPRLTSTGLLLGSPSYMSPEQVAGRPAGPASDLWALGATLFYAVEGKGPFDREGPLPTLMAISKDPVPEPRSAGPLEQVIVALLQKDPEQRPDPGTLRAMLSPLAGGPAEEASGWDPEETAVDAGPAEPDYVPPPAPAGLGAFVARHELEELSGEAAGPEADVPPPSDAAEDTWEDRPPAATLPVRHPTPAGEPPPAAASTPAASSRTGESRRNWAVAAGAVALLLLAVFLVPRLLSSPEGEQPEVAAPTAGDGPQDSQPEDSGGSGGDGGEPEQGEQPSQTQGGSGEAPARWSEVALGDTGYGIAHPPTWTVRQNPLGDGSSVRFDGPEGRYLLVDWTGDPGDDALEAWERQSESFAARHSNYSEIRLEETEFAGFDTAAVWEWTYSEGGADLHAIDLGFADDEYGFALNFQTRAEDWEDSQDIFDAFRASFGPR